MADFELIVMDDGTRDGSSDFIARCREGDSRVVHVRHERNSGLPALRVNEGITLARGRYVAFQFDDDEWRPDALDILTAAADRHGGSAVVVGSALWHRRDGTFRLPHIEPTLANLTRGNCIANNCVLVPRGLFDRHGMYDCHIAMRRLCDYDLWLRLVERVPFVILEEVVSEVHSEQEGSLELTVTNDVPLFRYLRDIPRDHLLTPDRWRDYEVDSLQIGGIALRGEHRRRFYEDQIVPYYLRMRHHFPAVERFPARGPDCSPRDVTSFSEDRFSRPVLLMRGLDALSAHRGAFKIHHQHPLDVDLQSIRSFTDAILLDRLRGPAAEGIARAARESGQPVAYLLPDDDSPDRRPRPGRSPRPMPSGSRTSRWPDRSTPTTGGRSPMSGASSPSGCRNIRRVARPATRSGSRSRRAPMSIGSTSSGMPSPASPRSSAPRSICRRRPAPATPGRVGTTRRRRSAARRATSSTWGDCAGPAPISCSPPRRPGSRGRPRGRITRPRWSAPSASSAMCRRMRPCPGARPA